MLLQSNFPQWIKTIPRKYWTANQTALIIINQPSSRGWLTRSGFTKKKRSCRLHRSERRSHLDPFSLIPSGKLLQFVIEMPAEIVDLPIKNDDFP